MPHKRSRKANIQRLAKDLALSTAYWDREKAEAISVVNRLELLEMVSRQIRKDIPIPVHEIPDLDQGLVLADPRGEGYFQKLESNRKR